MFDFLPKLNVTGKGSFRNVSFYIIDDAEQSGGHRLVKHEYPLRDDGKVENMGRAMSPTTINVVLIGDDCLEQRDALREALENPESGELQHPDFETGMVYIDEWRSRTSASQQRVVYFTITFVPDTDAESPLSEENGLSIIGVLTDVLGEDVVNNFVTVIDGIDAGVAYVENCMEYGEAVANGITNAIRGVTSTSRLSLLLGKAASYKASLNKLFNLPSQVANDLKGLLGGISDLRNDKKTTSTSKTSTSNTTGRENGKVATPPALVLDATSNTSTPQIFQSLILNIENMTDASANTNETTDALQTLVEVITVGEVVKAVIEDATDAVKYNQSETIVTYDDCEKAIQEHGDKLQELIIKTSDMYWYQTARALQDVKQAFVKQLEQLSTKLPQGKTITSKQTEPALVVLYRETGNSTPVGQFTRRNGLKHPTFATGGKKYEVINNG